VSDPLVSVVVTAYNVARYLPETLDSVLAQTHLRREIIVVDDGSTDNLEAALARFEHAITVIRQDNAGLGAARNRGLREVTGDYVAFLDADDLWDPSTLSCQIAVAHRHAEAGLVVCDGYQFGRPNALDRLIHGPLRDEVDAAPGGEIVVDAYPTLVRHHTFFCPAQGLLRRAVVDELGPVATDRNTAPDYDYTLRAAQRFPIAVHTARLVRYRYRIDSLSGPPERQGLVTEEHALTVLAGHLPDCRPDQAVFLERRIVTELDRVVAAVYHYGVDHDRSYARNYLERLRRLRPSDRAVILASAALAVPPSADPAVAYLIRRTRALRRRLVSQGDSGRRGVGAGL
jgi:glycosyltransferase involved in cell wall biosynthesis